ncbi:cupin domain protein [Paenibacillus sp. HGF7]|nr:cupin domain protein [Paenibacillus sp. HGF7]EPD92580.1 hypothetical protein HMPREF1207_00351 [Paenibacillus sp. HGH0039]
MAISYMDYTSPDLQFFYDLPKNTVFKTNSRNYINLLGYKQLNTLGSASLLDIYLSKGHYVEPHYHQNATELVYCVSGAATVSFINPFTNKLYHIPIKTGQVANVPQGWWHYEEASEDDTHLIAIFDAPTPEVILGSDILRLTPARVMAETYCLDEEKWKEAIAPITKTVAIGPLDNCRKKPQTVRDSGEPNGEIRGSGAAANVGSILPPGYPTASYGAAPAQPYPPENAPIGYRGPAAPYGSISSAGYPASGYPAPYSSPFYANPVSAANSYGRPYALPNAQAYTTQTHNQAYNQTQNQTQNQAYNTAYNTAYNQMYAQPYSRQPYPQTQSETYRTPAPGAPSF